MFFVNYSTIVFARKGRVSEIFFPSFHFDFHFNFHFNFHFKFHLKGIYLSIQNGYVMILDTVRLYEAPKRRQNEEVTYDKFNCAEI